jgi:hypothetical protein
MTDLYKITDEDYKITDEDIKELKAYLDIVQQMSLSKELYFITKGDNDIDKHLQALSCKINNFVIRAKEDWAVGLTSEEHWKILDNMLTFSEVFRYYNRFFNLFTIEGLKYFYKHYTFETSKMSRWLNICFYVSLAEDIVLPCLLYISTYSNINQKQIMVKYIANQLLHLGINETNFGIVKFDHIDYGASLGIDGITTFNHAFYNCVMKSFSFHTDEEWNSEKSSHVIFPKTYVISILCKNVTSFAQFNTLDHFPKDGFKIDYTQYSNAAMFFGMGKYQDELLKLNAMTKDYLNSPQSKIFEIKNNTIIYTDEDNQVSKYIQIVNDVKEALTNNNTLTQQDISFAEQELYNVVKQNLQ